MLDRLAEIKGKAPPQGDSVAIDVRGVTRPKFMEQFFKDVEEMQADLANIKYVAGCRWYTTRWRGSHLYSNV